MPFISSFYVFLFKQYSEFFINFVLKIEIPNQSDKG